MNKTGRKKALALSLALAVTLSATNLNAQNGGGLFGRGDVSELAQGSGYYKQRGLGNDGLTNRGGQHQVLCFIDNESFGAPVGSGLWVLLTSAVGYVAYKTKSKKTKSQTIKNHTK